MGALSYAKSGTDQQMGRGDGSPQISKFDQNRGFWQVFAMQR